MNYITLTPEMFQDDKGTPSMVYLSQFCQLHTTNKFIYDGTIYPDYFDEVLYPNLIKANRVFAFNIAVQFPDLEEVGRIDYTMAGAPNIGNLRYADKFYVDLYKFDIDKRIPYVKRFIRVIDKNTLIINGKELKVAQQWKIGQIDDDNYKEFGF